MTGVDASAGFEHFVLKSSEKKSLPKILGLPAGLAMIQYV
jgi:hypothetical protein